MPGHVHQVGTGDHGNDDSEYPAGDGDWTDVDDFDVGDNFDEEGVIKKEPMADLGQLVRGAYHERKVKRNRKGEYAMAQENNARNIDRILPYLAEALAKNRMVHCFCTPDQIEAVAVVCIDLLSKTSLAVSFYDDSNCSRFQDTIHR